MVLAIILTAVCYTLPLFCLNVICWDRIYVQFLKYSLVHSTHVFTNIPTFTSKPLIEAENHLVQISRHRKEIRDACLPRFLWTEISHGRQPKVVRALVTSDEWISLCINPLSSLLYCLSDCRHCRRSTAVLVKKKISSHLFCPAHRISVSVPARRWLIFSLLFELYPALSSVV